MYSSLYIFSIIKNRSSRAEVLCEKGVLRNFAKFTGKHLCHSIFLNKVAGLRPTTLLKKRLWHWCFPVNFTKFLRTPFYLEHLWWLLLQTVYLRIDFKQLRSSRLEVFCRKRVLRNFAKFTGKHVSESLFFNKNASWPKTLLKKRMTLA